MSADPELERVREWIAGFTLDPDDDGFPSLFDPHDVEIVPLRAALEGVVYRGPDAPRDFLREAAESWESLRFDPREVRRVSEDTVLVLMGARARSRDLGVELDLELGAVVTLRDGLVVRVHTYSDPAEAVRAVEPGS